MPTNVPNDPEWHLEKSRDHDVNGTWLVIVDGKVAGSLRPAWLRSYTRRHRWQGYFNSIRVGKPETNRHAAALHVLDRYLQLHGGR